MRTLQDNDKQLERRTSIIGRELARYNITIAALNETRLPDESQLEEKSAGYTFFWIGKPANDHRQAEVGFAIKSSYLCHIDKLPKGVNERLVTMRIRLSGKNYATIVSAYAPTMTYPDEEKENFYESLKTTIGRVPRSDKLIVLGDFNARVGRDHETWERVIGHHGMGNENANGSLLLNMCAEYQLTITNTLFQQANKYKTSWMHPRSKHWHLIDYVIVRQRDSRDVKKTCTIGATTCWSDHRMVRSRMRLTFQGSKHRCGTKPRKKLDVSRLKSVELQRQLEKKQDEVIEEQAETTHDVDETWTKLRDIIYQGALDVLGTTKRKHRDWFDENETEAATVRKMHESHLEWINDRDSEAKATTYRHYKQSAQARLRAMKEQWWSDRANELQEAADRKDSKSFYDGLKAIYGPQTNGFTSLLSGDAETRLTEPSRVLERWAEHFSDVLNRPSTISQAAIDNLAQCPIMEELAHRPTLEETTAAIKKLSSGKAAGPGAIAAEIYKYGGTNLTKRLVKLFSNIWGSRAVPQEFKDASIVHIYKRKGEKSICDNHRGISLLCIAGKILARILLNRLALHLADNILPESQCGFRAQRSTIDMIFATRQVQEKCREQNLALYMVFVDLTKAFDTISRDGLWQILRKIDCPDLFVDVIRSFHEGMVARVQDQGQTSEPFPVTNGTKQGCAMAPLLFTLVFSAMLNDAFHDNDLGALIRFRTDGNVFNLRRLKSSTRTSKLLIKDLLFADDCALLAHTIDDIQAITNAFARSARRFGLTISLKKTEVMYQPKPGADYSAPIITIDNNPLNVVDKFTYLGSTLSQNAMIDDDVSTRIGKASASFGKLTKRLWNERGVRLATKISVYRAVVLPTLL